MGETRGACAWSRLTLACIIEVNACEIDVVIVGWFMEECDPWAFDVEACALFLSSVCKLVGGHTWLMIALDG